MVDPRAKACARCARSKIKCVWTRDNTACQRCTKTNTPCSVPQAEPRKQRVKRSRVGALEQKVDGIISLLSAGQSASGAVSEASPGNTENEVHTPASSTLPGNPQSFEAGSLSTIPASEGSIEIVPGFCIAFTEADRVLEEYRTTMLFQFPFVPIPLTKSREMCRSHPLLIKAIIYACRPQDAYDQETINRWFVEHFARHIVILNEKSIELLQAILVFLAWREMEFYANAQDTSLLHLALGLAGDLGLARAPEDQIIPTSTESVADAPTMKVVRGINMRVVHTHADRRAMLGIFYLTSNIWSFLRRAEPLEYTDHIDKLCKDLKQTPEYPSDQLLVEIVDLQRITLQAGFMTSKSTCLNQHETLNTPLAMLIASQHKEVDRLVANIPQNIQYNHIIRSHYSIAVIRLHEPVIFMKTSNTPDGPLVRSQFLWTCLQTTKSMLTSILSFPGEVFSRSLLSMTAHIGFAHLTLTRLLFLNDPCWDAAMARKFVDYPGLVEQLAVYFESTEERPRGGARRATQAQTPAQAGDKKPPLSRTEKMRLARNWYLSKLPPEEMPVSGAFCQPTPSYDGSLGVVDGFSAHHWQMLFDSAFVP